MTQAVTVAVIDPIKQMILLLKRSSQSKLQGWCLPGGHIEIDNGKEEYPRRAACRELLEETGIRVEIKDLWHVGNISGTHVDNIIIYWTEISNPEIKLSEEHQGYVWVFIQVIEMFGSDLDTEWAGKTKEIINMVLANYHNVKENK